MKKTHKIDKFTVFVGSSLIWILLYTRSIPVPHIGPQLFLQNLFLVTSSLIIGLLVGIKTKKHTFLNSLSIVLISWTFSLLTAIPGSQLKLGGLVLFLITSLPFIIGVTTGSGIKKIKESKK